jgi:hypothetical protein
VRAVCVCVCVFVHVCAFLVHVLCATCTSTGQCNDWWCQERKNGARKRSAWLCIYDVVQKEAEVMSCSSLHLSSFLLFLVFSTKTQFSA